MGKAQGVIALGLLRRKRDQRLELRITAHDAVQGDELCRPECRCKAHEVSVAELHPAPVATPLCLLFGRGEVGGCRLEMHGAPDPAREQLMVKDADASSDIEERPGRDAEAT
jgi:hypothetical protein